ncbi:MAG: sodium-dependent bicarbonate transport family permease [Caldilineaceae bacterium]|nr:sodium-dependent bicarbonate transport family permease [Caldilineaceae bacterium]
MDWNTVLNNILSPAALFFFLGFLSVLVKSDLELPYPLPKFFSTYLLIAIGYTGGEKLALAGLSTDVLVYILAAMVMALVVPFYAFFVLRRILSVYDAAAMAATYGSISIVTFIVGTEFLSQLGVESGGYMVAIMSLMESPAVIMGILLVRFFAPNTGQKRPGVGALLHESFLNGTVLLLLGSLVIGFITGPSAGKDLEPFMVGIFKGIVLLFLLDVGMMAARKLELLRKVGPPLVIWGITAPIVNGLIGIALARALGMIPGDALLFTLLCASASYIVVPAAMRQAVPEANPGLFELLSLGVTFPFNIALGIPLFWGVIGAVWG